MRLYKIIALLLTYPEHEWLQWIGELRAIVSAETRRAQHAGRQLDRVLTYLEHGPLLNLQEAYVETFDRNPAHSLSIFELTMGESRDRGEAMVRLVEEYRRSGLEVTSRELPDFLPMFLEFLSLLPPEEAQRRLAGIGEVVQTLRSRLAGKGSPYAGAFEALTALTPDATLSGASSPICTMKRFLRGKPSGNRIEVPGILTEEPAGRARQREP